MKGHYHFFMCSYLGGKKRKTQSLIALLVKVLGIGDQGRGWTVRLKREKKGQLGFESRQVSDKFLVWEMDEKPFKWYN